jgi:hypothetical protein
VSRTATPVAWTQLRICTGRLTGLTGHGYGAVAVYGEADGKAFFGTVNRQGEEEHRHGAMPSRTVSVASNGMELLVVNEGQGVSGQMVGMLEMGTFAKLTGDRAGRSWAVNADEYFFTVSAAPDGPLVANDGDDNLPDDPGLVLAADPLLLAASDCEVVVAGRLKAGAAEPALQMWSVPVFQGDEGWTQIPLDPLPDALTDADNGSTDWWLAGHAQGHPVVYDRRGAGEVLTHIAVEHPDARVYLADPPSRDGMIIVVWDGERPATFYLQGGDGWRMGMVPEGEVTGARANLDPAGQRRLWVVADGLLDWVDLPRE